MLSSISSPLGRVVSTLTVMVAASCAVPIAPAGPRTPTGPAAAALQVVTEPEGGLAPIYSFLASARRSVDMTMYELADPTAESILAADAGRGVAVRVLLDENRERASNSAAFSYLDSHGVHVAWAPASYEATHEKAAVVDGRRALIMTLNLTARYYATTRDFAVIDSSPADVAAIESVFDADFSGASATPTPTGADLVWSPGSQSALISRIASAHTSLAVENEEMSDRAVVDALEQAATRGVRVEVTMTDTGSYHSEFSALEAAGVDVHTYPDEPQALYIHAKVIVVDGNHAFVGSENFTAVSLDDNRELGLVVANPSLVSSLSSTLAADFAGGYPWAS